MTVAGNTTTQYRPAQKQLTINKLPGMVMLHLKRFAWSGSRREKIQGHVQFPLTLDLEKYCQPGAASQTFWGTERAECGHQEDHPSCPSEKEQFMYDLVGVVVHDGRGINAGHYTSHCFNRLSNDWIQFNDARVVSSSADTVQQLQAYILFYSHRNSTKELDCRLARQEQQQQQQQQQQSQQ